MLPAMKYRAQRFRPLISQDMDIVRLFCPVSPPRFRIPLTPTSDISTVDRQWQVLRSRAEQLNPQSKFIKPQQDMICLRLVSVKAQTTTILSISVV
jgi:hypothetical protein